MSRVTDPRQLPALTALWAACFGDRPEEIQAFWENLFDSIRVYAEFSGKTALSMLCALPTELVGEDGEAAPCAYLYAVCTAPPERGRGHASRLLAAALAELTRDGFSFAALVPAEERLFGFYAAQGFQTACFCREYTVSAQKAALRVRPIDAEGYRNLREMQLYDSFISYPAPLLALEGGRLHRVETAEGIFCADCQPENDMLRIRELLPDAPEVAAALAAHFGCKAAAVRTAGAEKPVGMLRALDGHPLPENVDLPFDFG